MPERHIEFEGVINFRDLGGYRASQGATVRWGRLFRSGGLHYMTDADVRQAREMGIRSVLDLRRPDEVVYQQLGPFMEPPTMHHALPLVPEDGSAQLDERYGRGISGDRYRGYMDFVGPDYPNYYVRALELFTSAETYPAVFHCTAGKDRTGVIAALMLDILGVDAKTIAEDYALSNLTRDGLIAQLRRDHVRRQELGDLPEGAPSPEPPADWLPVPPEAIGVYMGHVRRDFGSARGYFEAQGVAAGTFDRLAELLLE